MTAGLAAKPSSEPLKRQAWTPDELNYLKENMEKCTIQQLADHLGRTYYMTHYQLKKMGYSSKRQVFTPEKQAYLKTHWNKLTPDVLATDLQTSKSVIYRQAAQLGLEVQNPTRFWTEEEETYLIHHWERQSLEHFVQHFNRSEACIRKKAQSFGLRRYKTPYREWSDEEVRYLKKHWGKVDVFDLAKQLDRTPESIRRKAGLMKLKRLRRYKDLTPWTPEQEAFLIEHWHSHSVGYVMRNLKKSRSSVYSKANRLKLGPKFDDGYTALEVAQMMGYCHGSSVVRWIEKGWLKAKRSKILQNRNYCIGETQLKTFMKAHQELWSFETLNFDPFHDSNSEWVLRKREEDRAKFLASLDE